MFISLLARIALEEGIKSFSKDEDEETLKDHLPSDIANLISKLAGLIMDPSLEGRETVLYLLLRLKEWSELNYQGRCIYEESYCKKAEDIFRSGGMEAEVFGNKDEVWLSLDEILRDIFKKNVLGTSPYFGCRFYGEEVQLEGPLFVQVIKDSSCWQGDRIPIKAFLLVGISSIRVDQSRARLLLLGRDASGKMVESDNSFEKMILSRLAFMCGEAKASMT